MNSDNQLIQENKQDFLSKLDLKLVLAIFLGLVSALFFIKNQNILLNQDTPFAIGIEEAMTGTRGYMVGATSWAAGIASGMHTRRLRLTIERFVLKNGVLPSKADVEEFWRIEQLQPVSFQADKSFASR